MALRRRRRGHNQQRPRLAQPPPQKPDSAPGIARAPQPPGPRRKTVLIVEDNATIGGLLVALTREAGYRALRAWDGREALRIARDRKPDLILLELSLPYPTGVPLLAELRGHPETKDAPIVMVTGNSVTFEPGERELLAEWVAKPVDIDRLENAIRRAIGDPEVAIPQKDYSSTVDRKLPTW